MFRRCNYDKIKQLFSQWKQAAVLRSTKVSLSSQFCYQGPTRSYLGVVHTPQIRTCAIFILLIVGK